MAEGDFNISILAEFICLQSQPVYFASLHTYMYRKYLKCSTSTVYYYWVKLDTLKCDANKK